MYFSLSLRMDCNSHGLVLLYIYATCTLSIIEDHFALLSHPIIQLKN
jgi:hypothetical protein